MVLRETSNKDTHYNEQGRAEVIEVRDKQRRQQLERGPIVARGDEGYQGRNHEATAEVLEPLQCRGPEYGGKLIENDPTFVVTTSQQSALEDPSTREDEVLH